MTARTRIKICGVRDTVTAIAAAEAGADAIGVVFAPGSPRRIGPSEAWKIVSALPPMVASVGVFADATLDQFCDIEEICPTDLSQLHGEEPDEVVRACGPGVIRAVRFDPATIRARLQHFAAMEEVAAILVDGSAGGEGVALDWPALAEASRGIATPIILAGGLNAQNVGEAIRIVRPWGVDVSSGVERERGVKDHDKIRAFCRAVRQADAARS